MRTLTCPSCQATVFFENTGCSACGAALAFAPERAEMIAAGTGVCANRRTAGCNWVAAPGALCRSCALTETIPDLSIAGNSGRWAAIETAKRRVVYGLDRLGLPLADSAATLRFRLLGDVDTGDGGRRRVLTGHENGTITLNIREADPEAREAHRVELGEEFRTLVGHFRHEVGHFYWDMLVERGGARAEFAEIFGDPGQDYGAALERHYAQGAPRGWELTHVSAYATAHPWEDFAESWAHYMHMVDGLETARAFGLVPGGADPHVAPIADLVRDWVPVTVAMNEMNRSLGQPDFYPFVLSDAIEVKLGFIQRCVQACSSRALAASALA